MYSVPGLTLFRAEGPNPPASTICRPTLCLVAQGRKRVGHALHHYDRQQGQGPGKAIEQQAKPGGHATGRDAADQPHLDDEPGQADGEGEAPLALLDRGRPRQQHPRLDLDQHRRHQQVLGRQFEVAAADLVDVVQVLAGHARHRDVEDVEVLLADQVQQQVQRALEGLEEHLQRVGRDVQVLG